MIWLILTVIAAIAAALCTFYDNYITDVFFKEKLSQSQKMFYGPAYLVTAVIMLLVLPIEPIPVLIALGLIGAGAIVSVSSITYYLALEKDDTTNVTIFQQFSPIFYLIFGRFILGEQITGGQLLAFLVVLSAPLLIIFTSRGRGKGSKIRTAGLILSNVAIAALGHTLATKFGQSINPLTMVLYVMIGKGLSDITIMMIKKKWRARFKYVKKRNNNFAFWGSLTMDHVLCVAHDFCYYSALLMAPTIAVVPTIIKAATPILVFFFGIILSIIWPTFGREKVNKKSVTVRLIATTLATAGVVLMQVL